MTRRALSGAGRQLVRAPAQKVWEALLDPAALVRLIPNAYTVELVDGQKYRATLSFGIGWWRERHVSHIDLTALEPGRALSLVGDAPGRFASGEATARVTVEPDGDGTTVVTWRYEGSITGPAARLGGPMLRVASALFVGRFFAALTRYPFRP